MKFISALLFALVVCFQSIAKTQSTECKIDKLKDVNGTFSYGWMVSIKKETERKKSGDSFIANRDKVKKCELELPSWGAAIYSVQGKKLYYVVEQGDTDYGSLSWIDPNQCKVLKTIREVGSVQLSSSGAVFSGGEDGPEKIPGKSYGLDRNCLPKAK